MRAASAGIKYAQQAAQMSTLTGPAELKTEHTQDRYSGESVGPEHFSRLSRAPQARTQSPKNWRRSRRGRKLLAGD